MKSPNPSGLPYGDTDRESAEDDQVPRPVVLQRLLQDEVNDAAEDRALNRAQSPIMEAKSISAATAS